ncbi:hypothetical protein JHK86_031744 [Glycine max]|nr:hypothetical protein JHK86_031744 [Glycine max]
MGPRQSQVSVIQDGLSWFMGFSGANEGNPQISAKFHVLGRFNGVEFLLQMKGKTMMFVGDSLGRNQWQSLICMIYDVVPQTQTQLVRGEPFSTFRFLVGLYGIRRQILPRYGSFSSFGKGYENMG